MSVNEETKLKEEGNEISFITARLTQIKNCDTENITINAISIYQAVLFAEDMLRAAGASPCDILTVERIIDKENV